jgi:hypothetical protein
LDLDEQECFMNHAQLLESVEKFSRKTGTDADEYKIVHLPDQKTIYIEPHGEESRSVVLSEVKVDGKTYWAGYSTYTQTVYISLAT